MNNKDASLIISLIIIFSFIGGHIFTVKETSAADIEALSFKQALTIPLDTSLNEAKSQPIDMRVKFLHPCWAKNNTMNSIRVAYDVGAGLTEIESQVYDLEFKDESHVEACSLVFLIPPEANGKENYYVLYDDSEVPSADYIDHLLLEDTHYYYEPISGQKLDFDYYKIVEDGYIIYGVLQKGEILGNGVSHTILRLKPDSTEFETVNGDQFASFAMTYSIDGSRTDTGTDWATEVSKGVLVDGNLMIRLRIEGTSPEGTLKTDNIYTYYYCPTATKRLTANVNHEVLQTVEVAGTMQQDGTYAHLTTFKSRSATIEKMNVGSILPSLHIYGEDDIIKEYTIPTDPSSEKEEWILSTYDDSDVGRKAWICVDDSSTGKAHGLLFHSNTGFLEEEDGLQIKTNVKQEVKLPGLDADVGGVYVTRNSYEAGGSHNTVLPMGMNVTFNAEFITFNTEGFEGVDKESELFQELVKHRPVYRGNVTEEEQKETYGLTAYVHLAPSLPLGSALSAVLGKNISYIYAELYRDNAVMSSGSIGRLPLSEGMNLEFENTTLVEKIEVVLGLFDWKNASVFKRIHFPNLEVGDYLIKVFKENPIGGGEHQYIGFETIALTDNASTHIVTRPEGMITLSILNQNGDGVENVRFSLIHDSVVVAEEFSDKNGTVVLRAPNYLLKGYTTRVIHKGFLIEEENIHLDRRISMFSPNNQFNMSLYDLEIGIEDTWGFSPAVKVNPTLISDDMIEPTSLIPHELAEGYYCFPDLHPADYTLKMNYKSFSQEEIISVTQNVVKGFIFPAEFEVTINVLNSHGMKLRTGEIMVSREGKLITTSIKQDGKATFSVPPGEYEIKANADGKEISREKIDVKGTKTINIVTTASSLLHRVVTYLGIGIIIASIILILWKKKWLTGIKLVSAGIILVALVSSWWTLKGEQEGVSTLTKTLLIPSKMVTKTSSFDVLGGAISSVPQEFTMVLNLLAGLIVGVCILIFLSVFLKNRFHKISTGLSLLTLIILMITIVLFAYAMSQVTDVGVGGLWGSGDLEVSMPGIHESSTLPCRWGPGSGFYLSTIATICLIGIFIYTHKGNLLGAGKTFLKKVVSGIRLVPSKKIKQRGNS